VSRTLLGSLVAELEALLEPLTLAAEDPGWRDQLLFTLGIDQPADAAPLVDLIAQVVELRKQITAVAAEDSPSFEAVTTVLDAADRAFTAIEALQADSIAPAVRGLDETLIRLLVGARLAARFPLLYRLLELLTIIQPATDAPPTDAVLSGDDIVRMPVRIARIRPQRLVDLLQDPVKLLMAEYLNELATADQAATAGDRLFPRVANVLSELDVPWTYGLDPGQRPLLGDAAPLLDHALTVFLQERTQGAPADVGVLLVFSSADMGDLGLVASPFGAVSLTREVGDWAFLIEFTAGVEAIAYGHHGLTLVASPGTIDVGGRVTATLRAPDQGPASVFGSPTGTRLELGSAKIAAETALSEARQSLAFSVDLSPAALVIAPSDGDSFLASLLPAKGVRTDFDLGIGWSSDKGVTFKGQASLDATIPVSRSFAGVSLSSVHIGMLARDGRIAGDVSVTLDASIGPVRATVDRVGVEAVLTFPDEDSGARGGNVGVGNLDLGFKPPSGVGLSVDGGPVTGGGVLIADPERGMYAGEVQLQFEQIAVRATGLLTTRLPDGKPGFSLLVIVSVEFTPVQLGLGFMLVGVGGLLGINRTVAVDALRAGLKTGALGAVLSPPDPKASAGQLVASLAGLFPPAAGRHVFAPTARIVWGSPTLITIELALVLELPAPVRLVALGRMRALLPDEREPIVRIQVDVLGVIDFGRAEAAVDATLVDSRLAQFALTGDMALRINWGDRPSFLLAVGGFHPRFAAPPGFPELQRVAVALAGGDNPKLRLEAYLALTSNTVQFGARVDLGARAGSFSIAGFLAFDALVTLAPLAFVVDIAAKLAVKMGGHTLLSVSLALTLSGPRPWRARGRASFSILFLDVSFGFDVTIGDEAPTALPPPVDVAPLLIAALADPRAWTGQLPAGADAVTLRKLDPGTAVLAHPLGMLQVRQRVAPLERTLDRFGSSVPSGARRFRITLATIGGVRTTIAPLQDRFAPAQFTALSDDAKLSAPSFEEMVSGAALGADSYATGPAVSVGVVYEQLLVTAPGIAEPKSQKLAMPADVFGTLTATPPRRPGAFAVKDTG
jgi:hypothetical protein